MQRLENCAAPKPRRSDGDLVQSLTRALTLLELLSERPCRLTELARRAALPASTTHRLLTTLEHKGFARFDRETSHWITGEFTMHPSRAGALAARAHPRFDDRVRNSADMRTAV
jgi:DNA-binding IclR family transcriptional regulator